MTEPDPVEQDSLDEDLAEHEARLMLALEEALAAKLAKDEQELSDLADQQ